MNLFMMRKALRLRWLKTALPGRPASHASSRPSNRARRVGATKPVIRPAHEGDPVEAIAASGIFDPAFYSRMAGADGGLRALVKHYLSQPTDSRITPSPHFDPAFYLATYDDVAAERADPFLHYVLHGLGEHRYPSLRRAEEDARAIKASCEFDEAVYRRGRGGTGKHPDPVLDYLLHGAAEGVRPNRTYEEDFVRSYYEALRQGSNNLFAFTCRHRERPWCHQSLATLSEVMATVGKSRAFDASFYRNAYLSQRPDLDELTHYCTEGYMLGYDPSSSFSTDHYFRNYTDISFLEVNPLFHYERHGKREGRKSSVALAIAVESGEREASPDEPCVLIVSHEASLTGAPIVGLRLAERMSGYANVVTWVGRDGPLVERFREASVSLVRGFGNEGDPHLILGRIMDAHAPAFAVVNSIVSRAAMPALIDAGVPVVSLVHEFAEYARPTGWMSNVVLNSQQAIVPARVIQASLAKELQDLRVPDQAGNVLVRPQGRCEIKGRDNGSSLSFEQILARLGLADADSRPRIVLGCGVVHLRKGVDIFIETARQIKAAGSEDVAFVWVGGAYKPNEDLTYSVYLADQVERSGLSGMVFFFREQADLDPFWRLADVFYLPSRLDPFPNVALDAIVEGIPLVCFQGATGIAEVADHLPESVFPVPYHDVPAAAETIAGLARDARERRRSLAGRRRDLEAAFSIDDYADTLFAIGRAVRVKHDALLSEAEQLQADGVFDAAFFHKGLPSWAEPGNPLPRRRAGDLAKLYVRLRAAGVELSRPFPGAISRPAILGLEPLAREIHADDVAFMENPVAKGRRAAPGLRPVLHVHLGATPDAPLLDALRRCASACDVRMTTELPNIARDLTECGEAGSPSFQVVADPSFGDPLASFLDVARTEAATLLGHLWLPRPGELQGFREDRMARALDYYGSPERRREALELFEADPKLGLLFPEHAAVRGSPGARAVAAAFAEAAGLEPAPAPERWPLDLVFWVHLHRLPGLKGDGLMEASRRHVSTAGLQDRLDGFGHFLIRLCEAAESKALAVHDPGEGAAQGRPIILRP